MSADGFITSELSERDRAIIADVARFRLLTTGQIQRLHFPATENGIPSTAARRARRALRRLVAHRYVVALDRRVGGFRAGSSRGLFALDVAGQGLLQSQRRHRAPTMPGARYVNHTVAAAEVAVQLTERARAEGDIEILRLEMEPACWRDFVTVGGRVILKPDLFVVIGADELEHWSFCEVDRATESLPTVRTKVDQYLRYLSTGIEQERHGLFPRVAWICPDDHRAELVRRTWIQLAAPAPQVFVATTDDEAVAVLVGRNSRDANA
jgi:hypothetical protein